MTQMTQKVPPFKACRAEPAERGFQAGEQEESAVVIASLQEFDTVGEHLVDQTVGLADSPGPDIAPEGFQVLGFADSSRGIVPASIKSRTRTAVLRLVSTQSRRSSRHSF